MKRLAFTATFLVTAALSFMAGRESVTIPVEDHTQCEKDYQVACKLSDIYRNICDNLDKQTVADIEDIYGNHVDNLDCDTTLIITKEDIESVRYYWSY